VYLLYSFAAAKGPWAFDLARFTVIAAACIIIFYLPFVLRHFIELHEHVTCTPHFTLVLLLWRLLTRTTLQLLYAWFGLTALIIAIWLLVLLPALEKALRPYLPTYTLGTSTGTSPHRVDSTSFIILLTCSLSSLMRSRGTTRLDGRSRCGAVHNSPLPRQLLRTQLQLLRDRYPARSLLHTRVFCTAP
jgi:hypothetical protein